MRNRYAQARVMHDTVQDLLKRNKIEVPEEWKYDNIIDEEDNTEEML